MKIYRISLLFISSLLVCLNLYAAPPSLPNNIVPITPLNMTSDLLNKPQQPLSSDKQIMVPALTQDLDLGQAKNYKFTLKKIKFTGNTVIATSDLESIFKPYYGKTVSLGDILSLVRKTTNFYRERGYILSQAYLPAQDIDKNSGQITVGIVEGFINSTTVVSEKIAYSTKVLLQQYGRRMESERPLTKATLERYALLASDISGGSVKVVFTPALNVPGAADLEFVAEDMKIFGGDAFIDNRSTRLMGPLEGSLVAYQYNMLYGNSTSISLNRAETYKELLVYSMNHRQPLNSDGLTLVFSASKSDTSANYEALHGASKSEIKTPGHSKQIDLGVEYSVIRSRAQNLVASLKLEGTNNKTNFSYNTLYKENLRKLKGGLFYDWIDDYFFGILGTGLIGADFTQGLPTFDLTGGGIRTFNAYLNQLYATRPNTKRNYTKMNGIFYRMQPIISNLNFKFLGTWQYAFDELMSSEEFGYGGRNIGLGYDSYEISGDHGISGKAELAYTVSSLPFVQNNLAALKLKSEGYVFYDAGKVWNINAKSSAQQYQTGRTSTGVGIRGKMYDYIVFDGYVAKPITKNVGNEGNKKARYFFSVGIAYH